MTHKLIKQNQFNNIFNQIFDEEEFGLMPFSRIRDKFFMNTFPAFKTLDISFETGAFPKADCIAHQDKIELKMEIPGLTKEQIKISIEDGILIISGEKRDDNKLSENTSYIFRELKKSAFKRSFQLSDNLDRDNIDASFENGTLTIFIKRLKSIELKSKRKKITIN